MSGKKLSYGSVNLVQQGQHRFYTFSIPSEVLARCCFVVSRDEDPLEGFQRTLDEKRAKEIAAYIDSGLGTIPSSIILSAQEIAEVEYSSKNKGIKFVDNPKSFLIIDGQHRIWGFKFSKTSIRVPVAVYSGLSKRDESRLFIDINSKQKGVSPALLLDIKKLAEYETDIEQLLREIFDTFHSDASSALYGRLSPAKKIKGKITRSVFNTSMRPLVRFFEGKSVDEIYTIMNSYIAAFYQSVLIQNGVSDQLHHTTVFKALCGFFPMIAVKVKDRYGPIYSVDNFAQFLEIVGAKVKVGKLSSPGNAYKPLVKHFEETLKSDFIL